MNAQFLTKKVLVAIVYYYMVVGCGVVSSFMINATIKSLQNCYIPYVRTVITGLIFAARNTVMTE
jgi:hypothetical protein